MIKLALSICISLFYIADESQANTEIAITHNMKIIVPPIGETIAITGGLSKPGIYELKNEKMNVKLALQLSGALSIPGAYDLFKMSINEDGNELIKAVNVNINLTNGDILKIAPKKKQRVGSVEIYGAVKSQGVYSLDQNPKLSNLK